MKCLNCGRSGHKTWQCPESDNVTASIICTACGGVGHIVKDCKARRPGEVFNQSSGGAELDGEYTGDDDNTYNDDDINMITISPAFLEDLGVKKKDMALKEDKPYVPPMGDLSKILGKPKPSTAAGRLMLTNGILYLKGPS